MVVYLREFRPAFLRMHYLFINHTETFLIKTTDWKHNFIEWLPGRLHYSYVLELENHLVNNSFGNYMISLNRLPLELVLRNKNLNFFEWFIEKLQSEISKWNHRCQQSVIRSLPVTFLDRLWWILLASIRLNGTDVKQDGKGWYCLEYRMV